jgi:hypothetical protein|tara:strand:- start:19479 stop:19778 length:300 start_codon:yes stop_codon:yes gene_type:complete
MDLVTYSFWEKVACDIGSSLGDRSQVATRDWGENPQSFFDGCVKVWQFQEIIVRYVLGLFNRPNLLLELLKNTRCLQKPVRQTGEKTGGCLASSGTMFD